MSGLKGQVALVTGAGGGIGRAICARFAQQGAAVAATDISQAAAQEAVGDQAETLALACDVGDADSVRAAVAAAVARFGKLTVLCNVAGGSTPADGPVTEAPEEEFWRAMRVDLFGTFLCGKYAVPEIARAGGGSVINFTSVVARIGTPRLACYSAAKGGVLSLTRSMAVAHAAQGVRVNAIAPGITRTPRVMKVMADPAAHGDLARRHVVGLVEPEDVAAMAVFLASPGSVHVTGQILQVDSGATVA